MLVWIEKVQLVSIEADDADVLGDPQPALRANVVRRSHREDVVPAEDAVEVGVLHEHRLRDFVGAGLVGEALLGHDLDLAVGLGDVKWYSLLDAHNSLIRSLLTRHGGTEVKSQGDGFMLTFDDPVAACRFSLGFDAELPRAMNSEPC